MGKNKYRTKIINYGFKEKVTVYHNPITYGNASLTDATDRQKYADMSEIKKMMSDDRRIRYYKRKVAEIIEIAMMNTDLNVIITLTFKNAVTSYSYAIEEWQLFLKRLRHLYTDLPLKYICVWEYQKERSKKQEINHGGIFHFHVLMNIGFINHDVLEKIWRNGFVWIDKLPNDARREKAVRYTTKYCVKEIVTRLKHGENTRGQRFILTSNNLIKPKSTVIENRISIENLIFDHMEDMLKDGTYEIKNDFGIPINSATYAEYKK